MRTPSTETLNTLRSSLHYREFLRIYFEEIETSYAQFSRRAGFSSRSFPRDVVTGKRRLSAKSLLKFQKALQLPAPWKKHFKLLVCEAEPDLATHTEPARLGRDLERSRETLAFSRERKARTPSTDESNRILKIPSVMTIFAALGSPEQGASLAELQAKTGLDETALNQSLKQMLQTDLVRADETTSRYFPSSFHLSLSEAGRSRVFQGLFERALQASRTRSQQAFSSERELFFTSSLCVKKESLPQLKTELRELLLRYVDHHIDTNGDQVVTLVTSLNQSLI